MASRSTNAVSHVQMTSAFMVRWSITTAFDPGVTMLQIVLTSLHFTQRISTVSSQLLTALNSLIGMSTADVLTATTTSPTDTSTAFVRSVTTLLCATAQWSSTIASTVLLKVTVQVSLGHMS